MEKDVEVDYPNFSDHVLFTENVFRFAWTGNLNKVETSTLPLVQIDCEMDLDGLLVRQLDTKYNEINFSDYEFLMIVTKEKIEYRELICLNNCLLFDSGC